MFCPKCKKKNVEDAAFCYECGAALGKTVMKQDSKSQDISCPNCGKEVIAGAAFCIKCGARVAVVQKLCTYCSKENPQGAAYCLKCGKPLQLSLEERFPKRESPPVSVPTNQNVQKESQISGYAVGLDSIICKRCNRSMIPISRSTGGLFVKSNELLCPLCGSSKYSLDDADYELDKKMDVKCIWSTIILGLIVAAIFIYFKG